MCVCWELVGSAHYLSIAWRLSGRRKMRAAWMGQKAAFWCVSHHEQHCGCICLNSKQAMQILISSFISVWNSSSSGTQIPKTDSWVRSGIFYLFQCSHACFLSVLTVSLFLPSLAFSTSSNCIENARKAGCCHKGHTREHTWQICICQLGDEKEQTWFLQVSPLKF